MQKLSLTCMIWYMWCECVQRHPSSIKQELLWSEAARISLVQGNSRLWDVGDKRDQTMRNSVRKSNRATQNHNGGRRESKRAGLGEKGGFGAGSLNEKLWRIQEVRTRRKGQGIQDKSLVNARCPLGGPSGHYWLSNCWLFKAHDTSLTWKCT